MVQIARTTTVPAAKLDTASRVAVLSAAGIVALQQRVVGNQTRVKVPARVIAEHIRGPLAELELWTDWREGHEERGRAPLHHDDAFDAFMAGPSGFGSRSWREALGEYEHARARAVSAMLVELERVVAA